MKTSTVSISIIALPENSAASSVPIGPPLIMLKVELAELFFVADCPVVPFKYLEKSFFFLN